VQRNRAHDSFTFHELLIHMSRTPYSVLPPIYNVQRNRPNLHIVRTPHSYATNTSFICHTLLIHVSRTFHSHVTNTSCICHELLIHVSRTVYIMRSATERVCILSAAAFGIMPTTALRRTSKCIHPRTHTRTHIHTRTFWDNTNDGAASYK